MRHGTPGIAPEGNTYGTPNPYHRRRKRYRGRMPTHMRRDHAIELTTQAGTTPAIEMAGYSCQTRLRGLPGIRRTRTGRVARQFIGRVPTAEQLPIGLKSALASIPALPTVILPASQWWAVQHRVSDDLRPIGALWHLAWRRATSDALAKEFPSLFNPLSAGCDAVPLRQTDDRVAVLVMPCH